MTDSIEEIPDSIHVEILRLCAEGDALAKQHAYSDALPMYWEAWDLIPEPKHKWDASTWVLAAVGDANFLGGDFVAGRENLAHAMQYPGAIGNPFLHLRLGQCQFELGNLDRAADELMRAYMGGGPGLFQEDDGKYIEFLATRAKGIDTPRSSPVSAPKSWWKFW